MKENENTYRYGAGSSQEQDMDIQRELERQARQREAEAQRVHEQQMRDMESRQNTQNQTSRSVRSKASNKSAVRNAQTSPSKQQQKTSNDEAMTGIIVVAGLIAGFYVTSVYIKPSEDWMIWFGIGVGGFLSYWLRGLIKVVLKVGIVLGGIYLVFTYILPALSS